MQLQDAGCWMDAATLAASHLKGSDYARFLLFPTFNLLQLFLMNIVNLTYFYPLKHECSLYHHD